MLAATLGVGVALALLPSLPAQAFRAGGASATFAAIEEIAGVSTEASEAVTLPERAGEAVQLNGTDAGARLDISPVLTGSRAAVSQGGTTLLSDDARSVGVQSLPNGVRLISVLADSGSPTSTAFAVTLPPDQSLQVDSLGGVLVIQEGVSVGRFSAPWAIDAAGTSLPTSYVLTDDTITQTIDTAGAQFPIVADPHYTWGIITGTVYFNKSETLKIAASTAFIAALGAFAPPPFNVIFVASAATISLLAAWAMADNECISIKTTGQIIQYSGSQGDGYCR